jgi:hypothetical protein
MSNELRGKIAEIVNRLIARCADSDTRYEAGKEYASNYSIPQILALLPSLDGWEKVEKCKHTSHYVDGMRLRNNKCPECNGKEIVTPLQFDDVDWDNLLIQNTSYPITEDYKNMRTKTVEAIRRKNV